MHDGVGVGLDSHALHEPLLLLLGGDLPDEVPAHDPLVPLLLQVGGAVLPDLTGDHVAPLDVTSSRPVRDVVDARGVLEEIHDGLVLVLLLLDELECLEIILGQRLAGLHLSSGAQGGSDGLDL